jgi:Mg2+-importing ATPase
MSMMSRRPDRAATTASQSVVNDRIVSVRAAREAGNDPETTLRILQTTRDGLTTAEAQARLRQEGPNEVAHDRPPHWLVQLAACFRNPFILVLVALAGISWAVDPVDLKPVAVVSVMVTISVALRCAQEYRSARAAERLKAMVRSTATVLRRDADGMPPTAREVPMQEVVPGDIVRLSAGDMVPADLRLLASRDLCISQAALTGESIPVEKYYVLGDVAGKSVDARARPDEGPLEHSSICFMGTNVVSGQGTGVVVAAGAQTYFGSLARAVVGKRAETSFDRGVNSVTWVLIRFMLVMVPVVLVVNGFTKGDWLEAFLFALSVAVGLTPEMLPLVVSANLAKGAIAMARPTSSSSMPATTAASTSASCPPQPSRSSGASAASPAFSWGARQRVDCRRSAAAPSSSPAPRPACAASLVTLISPRPRPGCAPWRRAWPGNTDHRACTSRMW